MADTDKEYPAWFTPRRFLGLFCAMSLLNYMDRGLIAANVIKQGITDIQDPPLNNTQFFLLPSMFMVGMMLFSPVFASLTRRYNYFRLMAVGLGIWSIATAGCSIAWNYSSMVAFRMMVGVGEASFCSMASPCIDNVAPKGSKSTWLAIFYMMTPVGTAFGYVFGGTVFAISKSWRLCFGLEAIFMLPFVAFTAIGQAVPLRDEAPREDPALEGPNHTAERPSVDTFHDADSLRPSSRTSSAGRLLDVCSEEDAAAGGPDPAQGHSDEELLLEGLGSHPPAQKAPKSFLGDMGADCWLLLTNPVFMAACLGYIFFTATCGVLINAGPTAGKELFPDFEKNTGLPVDIAFGLATMVTGVFGTCAGGVILDRMGSSMRRALVVAWVSSLIGCTILEVTFQLHTASAFMGCLMLAEMAAFAATAPLTSAYMWSVPMAVRPMACAVVTVMIHALGDVPSPPLAGHGVDILHKQFHIKDGGSDRRPWRIVMSICTLGLGVASAFWFVGSLVALRARDYSKELRDREDDANSAPAAEAGQAETEAQVTSGIRPSVTNPTRRTPSLEAALLDNDMTGGGS